MHSPITDPLRIQAWQDAVIDQLGQTPTSAYFEWLWVPRIGPSTAWLYRRLVEGLATQPDGYSIDLPTLAAWLGLGRRIAPSSPLVRSLERLDRFGLAMRLDDRTLAVRRRVPPLTQLQLRNLDPTLRRAHDRLSGAEPGEDRRLRAIAG